MAVIAAGAMLMTMAGSQGQAQTAAAENLVKSKQEENRLAFRKKWEDTMKQMQSKVCTAIEKVDGKGKFKLDEWTRKEGGGGWTKVLMEGDGECLLFI